jgi:hypothetical protein
MATSFISRINKLLDTTREITASNKTKIGNLIMDGTYDIKVINETVVTDNPTEKGFYVSDHSYIKPTVITANCIITNFTSNLTSIGATVVNTIRNGSLNNLVSEFNPLNVARDALSKLGIKQRAAYQYLEHIRLNDIPVTVVNQLASFPNMRITNLSLPKSVGNGDKLVIDITLKQSLSASVESAFIGNNIQSMQDILTPKTEFGKQLTRPPTAREDEKTRSLLHKIINRR